MLQVALKIYGGEMASDFLVVWKCDILCRGTCVMETFWKGFVYQMEKRKERGS